MRYGAWGIGLLTLAACSSAPSDAGQLTLNNPVWERVNVQVVMTKSANCDNRGEGFINIKDTVLRKGKGEVFFVPNGAAACWRHDRNPDKPAPGAWSGWSRATLAPGQTAETDI